MNLIKRFDAAHSGNIRTVTHISNSSIELGMGVDLIEGQLHLANGNNIYGVVMECEKIADSKYLVTLCTLGERVAIRLYHTIDKDLIGASMSFFGGELWANDRGIYHLQDICENYQTPNGTARAGFIKI